MNSNSNEQCGVCHDTKMKNREDCWSCVMCACCGDGPASTGIKCENKGECQEQHHFAERAEAQRAARAEAQRVRRTKRAQEKAWASKHGKAAAEAERVRGESLNAEKEAVRRAKRTERARKWRARKAQEKDALDLKVAEAEERRAQETAVIDSVVEEAVKTINAGGAFRVENSSVEEMLAFKKAMEIAMIRDWEEKTGKKFPAEHYPA
jgi:hypothetical protein